MLTDTSRGSRTGLTAFAVALWIFYWSGVVLIGLLDLLSRPRSDATSGGFTSLGQIGFGVVIPALLLLANVVLLCIMPRLVRASVSVLAFFELFLAAGYVLYLSGGI